MIQKAEQINRDTAVVLCDCGGTLGRRLDFQRLKNHLSRMPSVAMVKLCSKFCRKNECTKVIESLSKKQVTRLVIGACDQEIFDETLCRAMHNNKLNQGLLWCVNIREHCGWVTSKPKNATDKAIEILTASVRRINLAEPVKSKKVPVNQDVLILGGGVTAMQAAVRLSQLNHRVVLINNHKELGGLAAKTPELYAYVAADSANAETLVRNRVDELIEQVTNNRQIRILGSASVKSVKGEFGNFSVVVDSGSRTERICAGVVVLAVGSSSTDLPVKLAQMLRNGDDFPKRIALITDVNSEQGLSVSAGLLSAAELLVNRFGVNVKLYCHNIRVAARGLESLYRRARQAGVVVVKYETPPTITETGSKTLVRVQEPMIGKEVAEEFDVVLMVEPAPADNDKLLSLIEGLRAGPEGQLQYDNIWLLPTMSNREGIFVAGSARCDCELRGAQADGLATANEIHERLKNKRIVIADDAAAVDTDKCVLCLTCMRICPHGAVGIDTDKKSASISAVACERCGICAAQCPAGAIELPGYTDEQVAAEIGDKPRITVFACENSALPAATAAAINGSEFDVKIRLVRVPCAGKVDVHQVLETLERGAEKVMILGCHPESCQYLTGSTRALGRAKRICDTLKKAGFDSSRVSFGQLSAVEPTKFIEYVKE